MVTRGQNKARLNRFEDHRPEDIQWMLDLLQGRVETIKQSVIEKRGEPCRQILESAGFCFGQEAKRIGLVDTVVNSPEEYLQQRFGKDIQLQMKRPDWKEKLGFGAELIENTLPEELQVEDEFLEYCAVQAIAKIPDLRF